MKQVTQRLRLLVVLARPAVLILVTLFTAVGLAQAGAANDTLRLAKAIVAVVSCVLFAVAVNDIADARIDAVNLPGDRRRPFARGSVTRKEMRVVAVTSAVVALAASTTMFWPAPVVVAGGLVLTALYSLRPVRFAERGVVAPMLLPAGYVAVPYLLGILAVHGSIRAVDVLLLSGLYAGFIGRIVLKDFRDVRGDALFGKRTFLVRHGRTPTCVLSAIFLVTGLTVLPFVRSVSPALITADAVFVTLTLVFLRALAHSTSARRDEALTSAIAILGRGMVVTLYAHLTVVGAHWSAAAAALMIGGLTLIVTVQAVGMARCGPCSRLTTASLFERDCVGRDVHDGLIRAAVDDPGLAAHVGV